LNIQNFTDEKAPFVSSTSSSDIQMGHNTGLHNPYGRYLTVSQLQVLPRLVPRAGKPAPFLTMAVGA